MERPFLPIFLAVATICLAFAVPARAQDFTIASQNMLHLGQGGATTTTKKCNKINDTLKTADVLILQEVMTKYPCTVPAKFATSCSVLKGTGTYKEAYCFVYRSQKDAAKPVFTLITTKDAPVAPYIRPPYAVFFSTKKGSATKYIWIADIHSIFTGGVGVRQAEAQSAGVFFNSLASAKVMVGTKSINPPASGFPVIIGGDWNIPIKNKAETKFNKGFENWLTLGAGNKTEAFGWPLASPTSLSTKGTPSSPYDHFILTGSTLSSSNGNIFPSKVADQKKWRQDVSDHLGIMVGVTFK